jgi:4-hydroxy-3-methylbut-2-enyl diphosphate reductase
MLSLIGSLVLAFFAGTISFIIVAAAVLLGILFHVEMFSGLLLHKIGVKSLHDIPASRDIFSTLALSTVIVLVPAFSGITTGTTLQIVISFLITALLIFLRSILLHLVDIEEDRIVGRDTIPTYLGERTTVKIITYTTIAFVIMLFLLSILGIGWPGAFLFSINTVAVFVLIRLFRKKIIMRYYLFSLVLDLNLILSGVVAFLGKLIIK